jgi:cell wall-associated NlpC family hydrolase
MYMCLRETLVAQARQYLGVRFAHQGRSKQTGVDCLGLLLCVAQDIGLRLKQQEVRRYDRTDYGAYPCPEMLRGQLDHALKRVDDAQVGDVLLLKIEGRPQHLALVSDYPQQDMLGMIHAYAPMRKVVEHRLDAGWQKAIAQIYRVPEAG